MLVGVLKIYMPFIEKQAQLLTGGREDSTMAGRLPYQSQNPLYDKMHQILVELFDETVSSEHPSPSNSIFKADMLVSAISIDSYFFQRDVRGYSLEQIREYLCSIFNLLNK
jgi:hypothetical protein